MTKPPKSDDRSAEPIKGLSPRGQQLVKPRVFGKVTPSQEKREQ
jgi:hypothetical protein